MLYISMPYEKILKKYIIFISLILVKLICEGQCYRFLSQGYSVYIIYSGLYKYYPSVFHQNKRR